MDDFSTPANAPASQTLSRIFHSLQYGLTTIHPVIMKMYHKVKAHVTRSAPVIVSLFFLFLILAIVMFSFLAYLLVLLSVVFALILLSVSLALKLVAAIVVVIVFSVAVRTIFRFGGPMYREGGTSHVQDHKTSAEEIITSLKAIADETLKVLHRDYEQLRVAFPSLILQSGSSVRTLFLDIITPPPPGAPPYLSWWPFLTQVMHAIIEIDLTALGAIFGISGVIITSVSSISGSILGLTDTPRDIHSVAPAEPSGTSTSVSF